jgi:hypothetical protein
MSKRRMSLSEIEAAINRWEARLFRAATEAATATQALSTIGGCQRQGEVATDRVA